MQRMISGNVPACPRGHRGRHMHDQRGLRSGGGHFVECACSSTARHPTLEAALAEWRARLQSHGVVGVDHAPAPSAPGVLLLQRRVAP